MKSFEQISMEYNRAMSMTNELSEIAENFRKLTQQEAIGQLNTLATDWKGENSDHFVRKAADYLRGTSEISSELDKLARNLRANARAVYNAEMTALRLAQERNY